MRRRMLVAAAALLALLIAAPLASATIAYTSTKKITSKGAKIIVANDDGRGATWLGVRGSSPTISPDSTKVAYVAGPIGMGTSLRIRTIATGAEVAVKMVYGSSSTVDPAWSFDSSTLLVPTDSATSEGYLTGQGVNIVDAATGAVTVFVAPKGNSVNSYSWSPNSLQFAYASQKWAGRIFADVTRIANADGTIVRSLGRGVNPLWGPRQIAVHRYVTERWNGGSVYHQQIWLADPAGVAATTQLTHFRSVGLVDGPYAAYWSPDGTRLYGGIAGQDMSEPAWFNAINGRVNHFRDGSGKILYDAFPAALSADGATLLMRVGVMEGDTALKTMASSGGAFAAFPVASYEFSAPPTWQP